MATSRDTDRNRRRNRPGESRPTSSRDTRERAKRVVLSVLGGIYLVRGLQRRSLRGLATALIGGWMLYRGAGGKDRIERVVETGGPIDKKADELLQTEETTEVKRSITIGKPADELYEIWRDPDDFSRIMGHFADITLWDSDRFRWTVRAPGDRELSWETKIVEEEPGELIRWETEEDAPLPNEGSVRFRPAPADRGTEVTLTISFDPPGGKLGTAALEQLDIVPNALAGTALNRFKSLAETGEIQTLEGNPSARGTGDMV